MRITVTLLGLTGLLGSTAAAQDAAAPSTPAPAPKSIWSQKGFDFSGNLDTYYNYNFNRPGSALNQLRNFDTQSNRPALSMARFSVERQSGPVGFRVDVGTGRGYNVFHATEVGLGNNVWRHIPQAYASFRPIKGKAVQIDVGKFYTSAGAELTDTHLNWNYSRSLIFANGPYYHTGLRTSIPVTSKWTTGFQLVNGWNNVKDLNDGKSFGFTNAYTVNKKVSVFNNIYVGPEKIGTTEGWREFVDTVVSVTPSDKTAFYLNYDYGTERNLGTGTGRNQFQALAGAFRYQFAKKWAFAPRLEWYQDRDGFITGVAQNLKEVTTTLEYRVNDWALFRAEYRRDQSDQPYFENQNGNTVNSMNTVLAGLVVYWGPKK